MTKLSFLRHILMASVLVVSNAFAAYPEQAANDPYYEGVIENEPTTKLGHANNKTKMLVAPISVTIDKEKLVGAVGVEPTPQPENALDILREELARLSALEHEQQQKDGWVKSTTKRFAPESMTFFFAIGAVTFNSIWIKSHGDPLAMERHILSLKDPIAHMSFYAFMMANGFYINLRTSKMDAVTKQQMMKRLSYQGMAIGSLASSLISDLGQSGKMCVDYWILGRNDQQSVQACNEAWKHWTVRNKFQQYFPQIIAMWASQAVTEVIDKEGRKFFAKQTMKESAKKFFTDKVLVNMVKKITAVDVVMSFSSGTFAMKSIRWVGKFTQFALFVEVDHMMSPFTYRPLNNLTRPLLFDFDALAINNFWSAADRINWEDKRIPEANKVMCAVHNPNCFETKLVGEIENFGSQMQQWREHLNSDAETDIAGWLELTKKLLNQIDYSYKFYKSFTTTMFETLNIGSRIQSKELENSAAVNISLFPFRKLPFYGVSLGDYKTQGGSIDDLYLLSTAEIERKQKEIILSIVPKIEPAKAKLEGASLEKFNSILARLGSGDTEKMQNALVDMNQILGIYSLKDKSNYQALYSQNLLEVLLVLRKALGNPMPIPYQFAGHAQAFAANSTYATMNDDADFSLWSISKKYMFNKESDLMTYKIFCGNKMAGLDKLAVRLLGIGGEVNFKTPQFDPPSLLKPTKDLAEFCGSWKRTRDLKVMDENLYGGKIGQISMYDFFLQNFDYSIIGDFRNKENANNFDKWWLTNARQPLDVEFKKFDQEFKVLVDITQRSIFGQKSFSFNWAVDFLNQSKYLQNNIKSNLQVESNFYLQLISRTLNKDSVTPLKNKDKYLENVVASSKIEAFSSITDGSAIAEVKRIQELLNAYYNFILQDKVNFDQYIAHSKKIDTAMNDILVLAGLKISSKSNPKEVKSEEEIAPLDLSADEKTATTATPSATGTENSAVTYQDIEVKNPTLRQQVIVASVKGLRMVESEIRRFIRMKVALSQGLELDTKEFMDDWKNNKAPAQKNMSAPVKASPFGQSQGG